MFLFKSFTMTSQGKANGNIDWEALFYEETLVHIREAIDAMENELFGEFHLLLSPDEVISLLEAEIHTLQSHEGKRNFW